MENNLIKINKDELTATSDYAKNIQEQNKKIAEIRKKHLFNSLKEVTRLRINTAHNLEKWITILSEKIFNPESIEKLDINKAILLFKYINNINLKVLSDSHRLEEILGKYLQSGALDAQLHIDEETKQSDREKIKSEIMNKLNQMFKQNLNDKSIDAEIIKKEETSDEDLKLVESVDKEIQNNFDNLTESIDIPECDITDGLINQIDKTDDNINDTDNNDSINQADDNDDDIIELDDDF